MTGRLFRDAALQSNLFMRAKWKDLEQQSRRQAEAAGVTIVTDFDRKPFESRDGRTSTQKRSAIPRPPN